MRARGMHPGMLPDSADDIPLTDDSVDADWLDGVSGRDPRRGRRRRLLLDGPETR